VFFVLCYVRINIIYVKVGPCAIGHDVSQEDSRQTFIAEVRFQTEDSTSRICGEVADGIPGRLKPYCTVPVLWYGIKCLTLLRDPYFLCLTDDHWRRRIATAC